MKKILTAALVAFMAFRIFAEFDSSHSDYLFYNTQEYQADYDYLEESLASAADDAERADILWRLSRTRLTLTDNTAKSTKRERIDGYNAAQSFAEQSIAITPIPNAYFWLASAVGRIGQENGILNSLSRVKPMLGYVETAQNELDADLSDAWHMLGVLYNMLPGAPLSFGNKNYAISYMRRCLDTQDNENCTNLSNYKELSDQLYKRAWSAEKRGDEADIMKSNYDSQSAPTEKMKYYEGKDGRSTQAFYAEKPLDGMSDREEAVLLLEYALSVYNAWPVKLELDTALAKEISERLDKISK